MQHDDRPMGEKMKDGFAWLVFFVIAFGVLLKWAPWA